MTDKVISADKLRPEHIQKYTFRAFDDSFEHSEARLVSQEVSYSSSAESSPSVETSQPRHIETLLSKVDDLSTSLVKMEMQIERQQSDFDARLEAEVKRSYDDGLQAGIEQAGNQVNEKVDEYEKQLLESIKKMDEVAKAYSKGLKNLDHEILNSALVLAKQVIAMEVSFRAEQIATSIAKEVVSKVASDQELTLKVHPDDWKKVNEAVGEEGHVTVVSDAAILRGGVILHSETKNIDASLTTRFDNLTKNLFDKDATS